MKEEIELAADAFVEKYAFQVPYDGSNKFYNDEKCKYGKDGFIAGAQWQASQPPVNKNDPNNYESQPTPVKGDAERKFFIDEISPMIKAVINKEMSISKFVELLNEISNRDIDEWMKENPPFGSR